MVTAAEAAENLRKAQEALTAARNAEVRPETARQAFAKVGGKESIALTGTVQTVGANTTRIDYNAAFRTDTGARETDRSYFSSDIPAAGVTIAVGQEDRIVFDASAISNNRTIRMEQNGNGKIALAVPAGAEFDVQYDERTKTATMTIQQGGQTKTIRVEGVNNANELEVGVLDRSTNTLSQFATVGQIKTQQAADDRAAAAAKQAQVDAAQAGVTTAQGTVNEIAEAERAAAEAERLRVEAIDTETALSTIPHGRVFEQGHPHGMGNVSKITGELELQGDTSKNFMVVEENGVNVVVTGEIKDGKFVVSQAYEYTDYGLMQSSGSKYQAGSTLAMNGESVRMDSFREAPLTRDQANDLQINAINNYRSKTGWPPLTDQQKTDLKASNEAVSPERITEVGRQWDAAAVQAERYKTAFNAKATAEGKDPAREWEAAKNTNGSDVNKIVNGNMTVEQLTAAATQMETAARTAGRGTAPSGTAPTAPTGTAPTAPTGAAPTAPTGTAPTAPTGAAPTAPTGTAPTAPTGAAPTAPTGTAPTAPSGAAPTNPEVDALRRELAETRRQLDQDRLIRQAGGDAKFNALKAAFEREANATGKTPQEREREWAGVEGRIKTEGTAFVDVHTANLNSTADKVESMRRSFDAMHTSRGSTQQERDAEWAGAMDRLKKEGPGWLDAHRQNLDSLKYGYDVLKPAIEANLRAAGVPDNQLQARVAGELTKLNDPIVNNRDASRGQYWVREHRDAINQDTRRLPTVMGHVDNYANAVGANEAERAALREKFRATGNGISDEQNRQYQNNGQGPINDLGRLASAAQQYRNTFNAQYEAAGLNPQQVQAEWDRQKRDPNTVAGKLTAGTIDLNSTRSETTQLASQQPHLLKAQYDNTRLAEHNAELERQLAARPVTPAGAPTAGGTTFTTERDGRQIPVTVTMEAGKRIAKDPERKLLAAGTIVTANIPMAGSTTPMSLRLEVKESGTLVNAPGSSPVATAAPVGPTR